MRLNKFLAEKTGISRRQADELISAGKVSVIKKSIDPDRAVRVASGRGAAEEVFAKQKFLGEEPKPGPEHPEDEMDFSENGVDDLAKNTKKAVLGQQITEDDIVLLDGKPIDNRVEHKTILLNKPVGYLSSRASQGGDPTVYNLLPQELKNLKTAGRLDKDSSGLMILSSDGDLIQQLTHPKYGKTKVYEVELDKPLEPLHQQMISDFGIDLPDGKSQMTLEKFTPKRWRVALTEGRNRQIRRTFAALGYDVKKLHRTNLGPYSLDGLDSGKYREIMIK